jgi:3-methyladenine DNA glycosylase Tag
MCFAPTKGKGKIDMMMWKLILLLLISAPLQAGFQWKTIDRDIENFKSSQNAFEALGLESETAVKADVRLAEKHWLEKYPKINEYKRRGADSSSELSEKEQELARLLTQAVQEASKSLRKAKKKESDVLSKFSGDVKSLMNAEVFNIKAESFLAFFELEKFKHLQNFEQLEKGFPVVLAKYSALKSNDSRAEFLELINKDMAKNQSQMELSLPLWLLARHSEYSSEKFYYDFMFALEKYLAAHPQFDAFVSNVIAKDIELIRHFSKQEAVSASEFYLAVKSMLGVKPNGISLGIEQYHILQQVYKQKAFNEEAMLEDLVRVSLKVLKDPLSLRRLHKIFAFDLSLQSNFKETKSALIAGTSAILFRHAEVSGMSEKYYKTLFSFMNNKLVTAYWLERKAQLKSKKVYELNRSKWELWWLKSKGAQLCRSILGS